MELLWMTLGSWAAFTAVAVLSGLLVDQVARGCGKARA